jgi:hypothetical protein
MGTEAMAAISSQRKARFLEPVQVFRAPVTLASLRGDPSVGRPHRLPEETTMSQTPPASSAANSDLDDEPVPMMQQLIDNPFLLLFLGVAMPTVLYIVWGVMEIVGIPLTK